MPEKTAHAWEEIVTQLTQEQDGFRVVELAHIKAECASRSDDRHDSLAGYATFDLPTPSRCRTFSLSSASIASFSLIMSILIWLFHRCP